MAHVRASAAAHALLLLLLVVVAVARTAAAALNPAVLAGLPPLSPGEASVSSAKELLQALEDGVGDITLEGQIVLTPEDWGQYDLPIQLAANSTVLIHWDDYSGLGLRPVTLDWGYAMNLIDMPEGSTLAFDGINSKNPGNYSAGLEVMDIKNNGSFFWPTINGQTGSTLYTANSFLRVDDPKCSPETTEAAIIFLRRIYGNDSVTYLGGVTTYYPKLLSEIPVFSLSIGRILGVSDVALLNTTSVCFNSLDPVEPTSDGGTPTWVWAVVGTVVGLAVVAVVAGAFLLRRRRRALAAAAAGAAVASEEGGDTVSTLKLSGGGTGSWDAHGSGLRSSGNRTSGELQSTFMRTRFGIIDDLQLGDILGRGAFGRVYKGRWKGAIVAVKIIEHRVQEGKTYDLSREPLLSMSVSHPNVVATHQMCVVRISGQNESWAPPATAPSLPGSSGSAGSRGASGSGGRLVPALGGGSGMVEVVSPHDVLQPGMFETWLVLEWCDRGSLAEFITTKKLPPAGSDPQQREAWILLCLLDIALGLNYLHSSGIVHGDLKPANVLLKSARSDRRGFGCKLADFGLSRMLGQDESHVDTQSFGTPSFAAPELLTEGKLTRSADIYSLAMIVWELCSGEELYRDLTSMQVIIQVSQHQHRPDVPPSISPSLQDLMTRCWAQDAGTRPSASQVVDELRAMLSPLMQRAPSRPNIASIEPAPPA